MEPSPTTAPKHRSFFNKLKHPSRFSKPQLAVFVLAFALIGFLLIKAFAAAPLIATLQAEQMTPSISSSSVPTKTFGRTTIGSTWTGGLIANDRFIQKFSLSDNAQVSKLSYYLKGDGTGSQVAKAIIYADSNGSPATLMGQGTEVKVTGGQQAGWVDFSFANPVNLPAGNYWIGLIRGDTGGTIDVATDTSGGSEDYSPNTYANGALNPFGAIKGTTTYNLSGYASYTVPSITKTFGNTAVGAGWTGGLIANDRFVQRFNLTDTAQVSKLTYYLRGDSSSPQVAKAIIYADSNGSPAALVGQGNEVTIAAGKPAGWLDFTFANPVNLPPGNYWIGLLRGDTAGNIDVATDKTGGTEAYAPNTYTSGALNPFGAVKGTSTYNLSGYATYTVGTAQSASSTKIVSDSSASNGQEMELLNNNTLTGSFSLPSTAASMTVMAKANVCSSVGAAMTVSVDGNKLISTTVNSTSLAAYSANTNLAAGSHSISISYTNDSSTSTCDRNLYVDVTNFYGPTPAPTPAPTVALSTSPSSVIAGQSATLTWSSTNAASCAASGAWSGTKATSGSVSTGALNQTSTYTLTCTGSAGSATASTTVSVGASTGGAGSSGIGVYELGGNLAYLSTPNIYSIVIGDAWDNISTIQNVTGRGLAYFSPVSNPRYSTGIPYTQASSNGWILKCGTADCINPQFSTYGIDLGSTAVQQAWISNVESYLAGHPGIDGVFMDTVIYDPYATFKAYPNKYPDTASWDQAMLSFMKAVHAALNAKGYYLVSNTGAYRPGSSTYNDGSDTIAWFKMVGPYTDGMMNEFYDEASGGNYLDKPRSTGTAWYQNWDGWQRLIGVTQSMGKDFFGGMYGGCTDTTQMTYGKASFLLEWNGGSSVFAYNGGKACNSTNAAWTKDVGKPAAAKVQVGVGWMRTYTKGTVLVNPSPSSSQTFTVNGTSYTLAPTTARIL